MKHRTAIVVIAAAALASLAWWWVRSRTEGYGASPYGAYASELLGFFPPAYRTRDAARAVLADVSWQLRSAAKARPTDAVPCALVFEYVNFEGALSQIPIEEAWNVRSAVAALRQMLDAAAGENCWGGFTTFANAAALVDKLYAAF